MKVIKKILHIKLTILVLLLLPLVIFTLITSKTPVIAGIQSFVVLTGSMSPTIAQGSMVFIQKHPVYRKGDVVSYKRGNVIITHRIVGGEKQANGIVYRTKGDANTTLDQKEVAEKDVLGKAIFYVPYIGKLVLFLKTFQGFALFIIFPTVLFIVFELNVLRKEVIAHAEKKAMERMGAL